MVPEAWKYVLPLTALAGIAWHWTGFSPAACAAAVVAIFCAAFFRNPAKPSPAGPEDVLSPAAGFVIEVVEEEEPDFIAGPAVRVSVFMTPLDVHVNTAPVSGIVRRKTYRPGTFYKADKPEARLKNERMSIGIETPDGRRVYCSQVAGWLARRILCDVGEADSVERGRRYGLIQFGSRCDLMLPRGSEIFVKAGQHIRAAATVIGRLPGSAGKG